jgi:hypothetical protein
MSVFDDKATGAMADAYKLASGDSHRPEAMLELIAKRILDGAAKGERNPMVLANTALDWLGMQRVAKALTAELDVDSVELGLRLLEAFGQIPLAENKLALVKFAEALVHETAAVGKL